MKEQPRIKYGAKVECCCNSNGAAAKKWLIGDGDVVVLW